MFGTIFKSLKTSRKQFLLLKIHFSKNSTKNIISKKKVILQRRCIFQFRLMYSVFHKCNVKLCRLIGDINQNNFYPHHFTCFASIKFFKKSQICEKILSSFVVLVKKFQNKILMLFTNFISCAKKIILQKKTIFLKFLSVEYYPKSFIKKYCSVKKLDGRNKKIVRVKVVQLDVVFRPQSLRLHFWNTLYRC